MPSTVFIGTETTLYKLDETKAVATVFNGAAQITNMTSGVIKSNYGRNATVDIPAGIASTHYLALSMGLNSEIQIAEEHLAGIVITLEEK